MISLACLLLVGPLASSGAPAGAPAQAGAGSSRTALARGARSISGPVVRRDELLAAREFYAGKSPSAQHAGDLIVFGPEGEALEGASVALVEGDGRSKRFEVLEVVKTDAEGRADLQLLALADIVAVWSRGLPSSRLEGELLEVHRELAGLGAMLVRLDPSDVVTGRVTVDGDVPSVAPHLSFYFPWSLSRWPVLGGPLASALAPFDPPARLPRVEVSAMGVFRVEGFRWPFSSSHDVLPAMLSWSDKDLFLADASQADGPTLSELHGLRVHTRGAPIELRLTRGGFVEGRVTATGIGSLGRELGLRFEVPGAQDAEQEPEFRRVEESGAFRFALPLPFPELELQVQAQLWPAVAPQAFSFAAPGDEVGRTFDLGELTYRFTDTRLLLVRDQKGAPVQGASTVTLRQDSAGGPLPRLSRTNVQYHPSNADGKLLAPLPEEGWRLVVLHPDFEPAEVTDFGDGAGAVEVALHRASILRLRARLPEALPAKCLFVEVEAAEPALRLHDGDRTRSSQLARESADGPLAERLCDANSAAAWSFTQSFAPHDRRGGGVPNPKELQTLDLAGVRPGVPFHLRVFTPSGGVFLDEDVPSFLPGEEREFEVLIPASLHAVRGRVLDPNGRPAQGLNLHFGSRTLAYMATTGQDGRFEIEGLSSLEGRLLVERTSIWNACFDGGSGISGRRFRTLLLDEHFRFEETGETVVELPEGSHLEIRIVDIDGDPSNLGWNVDLYDARGTLPLGVSNPAWLGAGVTPGEYDFVRPPGIATVVVASFEDTVLRRTVLADEERVRLVVFGLGRIELSAGPVPVGDPGPSRYVLTPLDGGAVRQDGLNAGWEQDLWRFLSSQGPAVIGGIPPGNYLFEVRSGKRADGTPRRLVGPLEITVQADATTHLILQ